MSPNDQRARLEACLERAGAKLRRIFELLEVELESESLTDSIPPETNLAVSKAEFPSATYLVTRVPVGLVKDLSPRQQEVLSLLLEGLPRKTIAFRLGISESTSRFLRTGAYPQ